MFMDRRSLRRHQVTQPEPCPVPLASRVPFPNSPPQTCANLSLGGQWLRSSAAQNVLPVQGSSGYRSIWSCVRPRYVCLVCSSSTSSLLVHILSLIPSPPVVYLQCHSCIFSTEILSLPAIPVSSLLTAASLLNAMAPSQSGDELTLLPVMGCHCPGVSTCCLSRTP